MRLRLTISLFAAVVGTALAAPIDFTPSEGTRTQEGVVFKQLLFHQDGHEISYEPPAGWTCNGDPSGLRLTPGKFGQAQATVLQTPLPAPQVFDEPTTKQLQQLALSVVPPSAQNLVVLGEEMNPIQIHGQPTYGFTFGYNFTGQDYEVNVLFVNLGDTQLRFRTVARKADFEQVLRQFRGSLFSLSWK